MPNIVYKNKVNHLKVKAWKVLVLLIIMFQSIVSIYAQTAIESNNTPNGELHHFKLGKQFYGEGKMDSALVYYLKAEQEFLAKKDTIYLLNIYLSLMESYRKLDYPQMAAKYSGQISEITKKYQVSSDFLMRYFNRCAAIMQLNNEDSMYKKIAFINKSIILANEIRNKEVLASNYNELAYTFEHLNQKSINQKDSILFLYHESKRIYQELGNKLGELMVLKNLARYHHHQGNYAKAIHFGEEAINIKEKSITVSDKWYVYYITREAYRHQKNYKKAYELAIEECEAAANVSKINTSKVILEYKEAFESEKKEKLILSQEIQINKTALKTKRLFIWSVTAVIFSIILIFLVLYIKSKNKKLKRLANENDFLIEEANHRIKNNLQLIVSLIERELMKEDNEQQITGLTKIAGKIGSIATLHKQLYTKSDKELIQMDIFLKDLFKNLQELITRFGVSCKVSCEPFEIPNRIAGYIGILITELCMNSLKYAFDKEELNALITCNIKKQSNDVIIVFSDNGKGLTPGSKLTLIDILCDQLNATYEMKNNHGLSFQIILPG